MTQVAVVGAGPVGCYTAYLLARRGFKVSLFDQKKRSKVGCPVQCTGLLTAGMGRFVSLEGGFLVNTFSSVEVFSPEGRRASFSKKEYLVDRKRFDKHLFDLAVKEGVVFNPEHKLVKVVRNGKGGYNLVFGYKGMMKIFSPKVIIGADGPGSLVYRYLNPSRKRKFYYGLQGVVKGDFKVDGYQTFFGKEVCPKLFGWLVPESKGRARVGVATQGNPQVYFERLLERLGINEGQVVEKQGGMIPVFDPKARVFKGRMFLLGDAAGQVKATTLGGLVPAFEEANNLVSCLVAGRRYKPRLRSLKLHLFLRKMLNRFSDRDYEKLICLLGKRRNKRVLEKYSREKPGKLVRKMLLQEPRLWRLGKYLF